VGNNNRWVGVDVLLNTMAERNPDFRVVFRGCFYSFLFGIEAQGRSTGMRAHIESYLPLGVSNGLVTFEGGSVLDISDYLPPFSG